MARFDKNDFQGRTGSFGGWIDNPLIDGDKIICTPGGKEITLVALNKLTGEVIWKAHVPEGDAPSSSPAVIAEFGGVRQYVQLLSKGLVGIAAADGRFLWRYNRIANGTANVPTPIIKGDHVFASNGYGTGSALLKLTATGGNFKVEELYFTRLLQNLLGGVVGVGDHVYAGHSSAFSICVPTCLDLKTGKIAWQQRIPGNGIASVLAADGHLIFRFADGWVYWIEANPTAFKEKGKFLPLGKGEYGAWTMPTIAAGRLYLRDQNQLFCYDLRRQPPRAVSPPKKGEPPVNDKGLRDPDAVFVPTPPEVVEQMLQLANVRRQDVVYDLGSGDGRIVIGAAKKFQAKGVGIEIDPKLVDLSRLAVKKQGLDEMVSIRHADLFTQDLREASVITLYLLPELNLKLLPQLKQLKPGTRIVSHGHDLPGYRANQVLRAPSADKLTEHILYLWITPLMKEKTGPV